LGWKESIITGLNCQERIRFRFRLNLNLSLNLLFKKYPSFGEHPFYIYTNDGEKGMVRDVRKF